MNEKRTSYIGQNILGRSKLQYNFYGKDKLQDKKLQNCNRVSSQKVNKANSYKIKIKFIEKTFSDLKTEKKELGENDIPVNESVQASIKSFDMY